MNFKNTKVMNFKNAFWGLRNPLESWTKSDSLFGIASQAYCEADWEVAASYVEQNEKYDFDKEFDKFYEAQNNYSAWLLKNGILTLENECLEYAFIGPKDLDLAHRMIKAGTSDSKFLRQIFVSVDITAPLYWWKEMDTYKVGTVANSTSTMHKLASTPIDINCFETDDIPPFMMTSNYTAQTFIRWLEELRQKYLETKDKRYWKELIRWLPESWLQTRTWTANYAVLRNIYFQRQNHKLSEWHSFCDWIKSLPYADDLIIYTGDK